MACVTLARAAAALALASLGGAAVAVASAPSATHAGETAASAPAIVISDVAHWQHPVKAVFQQHGLTLMRVALHGRHATFRVAFPFDPGTQPNAALMRALAMDVLQANGWNDYSFESLQDDIVIDVAWNRQARTLSLDSHRP